VIVTVCHLTDHPIPFHPVIGNAGLLSPRCVVNENYTYILLLLICEKASLLLRRRLQTPSVLVPAYSRRYVPMFKEFCVEVTMIPSASFFRPLDWVREKLATGVKENQSEEEIQAAKEQAKKEGVSNLFEGVSVAGPGAGALTASREKGGEKGPSRLKSGSVRCIRHILLSSY